jgi:uncharacterized protein
MLIATILLRRTAPSIQLLDAAERGDLPLVKSLIQQGVPINQRSSAKFGWTPLIGAIFQQQTNVVEYLVQSGANVNLPDNNGVTPLMWMTGWGDQGVSWVRFLIEHGARLDAKDKYGATASGYAKGDPPKPELIKILDAATAEQKKSQ